MAVTTRYTIHPPQLVGRISLPKPGETDPRKVIQRFVGEWDGSMQELQRFLKYLMDSSDMTQENITNIDNSVTNLTTIVGGLQLGGTHPTPHTHGVQDILGLPAAAPPRPPSHTHLLGDVVNAVGDTQLILASQVFGG